MGTSSSYKPPTKGNWGEIKRDLSRIAKSATFPDKKVLGVIGKFISEKGGGGSTIQSAHGNWTKAPREAIKRIGGFVSDFGHFGFAEALNKHELGHLIGKSAQEIIAGLIDYFGGSGNTRDETNTRRAISSTMDMFMKESDTPEKIQEIFKNILNPGSFQEFLLTFLGHYIFQQFCSIKEEFLNSKMKERNSEDLIKQIERAILAAVKNKSLDIDFSKVDWKGEEGDDIKDEIIAKTFRIFGD